MVQHTAKQLFIHATTLVFLSGGQTFALTPQTASSSALLARSRQFHESAPSLAGSELLRESKLAGLKPRAVQPLMAAADAAGSKGSTVTASVINLSKNIVGSGILALAGGVAAFSSSPFGIIPALAVLFFLGAASGYSFSLIARVGDEWGADTCMLFAAIQRSCIPCPPRPAGCAPRTDDARVCPLLTGTQIATRGPRSLARTPPFSPP